MIDLESKIVDYWNRQPCNVNHSASQIGSLTYFEEVTAKRYRAEPHILDFAGFHLWRGKRVLEIGCGIGTDAEQFARHGAVYTGIDISQASLDLCRQRFDALDLQGVFLEKSVADIDHLLELEPFDLVYSYGVLHHFPNIQQNINNIAGLLLPHGELRFMVYARDSWKYAMIQKGLDQFEAQADCPYAQAFTRDEITAMLMDKYDLARIRQDHCFMYNIAAYKQGRFELEPWFEAMPDVMRDAVRQYLGWHLLVKATRK